MASTRSPRQRFTDLVSAPGDAIDLAEATLLIAAETYRELDVARYLRCLDDLAAEAAPTVRAAGTGEQRVRRLVEFLAVERGFRGNQDDYYDRRNSFLNDVLDRRTGIPITLAVLYLEVARRLGLTLHGVGFPGHFLVKHVGTAEMIIDPFFGQILSPQDCEQRLHTALGPDAHLDPGHLHAATTREMLVRMLRNLKQIYLQARELASALACSERILLVDANLPQELRDRGLLYEQFECYAAARADLERFLTLAPNDPTADAVRERVSAIDRHGPILH